MQVMLCRLENSFTNMFPTIMDRLHRMGGSHVMGGYFRGLRPVGQPRSRRKDAVWRDDVDFFQIRDWKTAARERECWSEKFGEATAPEPAESPHKPEKKFLSQFNNNPVRKISAFEPCTIFKQAVFEYAINQPYKNTSLDTILLIIYHQRHVSSS